MCTILAQLTGVRNHCSGYLSRRRVEITGRKARVVVLRLPGNQAETEIKVIGRPKKHMWDSLDVEGAVLYGLNALPPDWQSFSL